MSNKIASEKRDEFRRTMRAHHLWRNAREVLNLPKNPDSQQWLDAAEYMQIDITPYTIDGYFSEDRNDYPPLEGAKPLPVSGNNDLAAGLAELIAKAMPAPQAPEIDESKVISLIHEHSPKSNIVTISHITKEGEKRDDMGTVHKDFQKCIDVLNAGENLQMVGPAGSGKTTLARQLHRALFGNRDEMPEFAYTGALAQEYKLFGFVDANGNYRETPFYRAYTNGGTFFFDEFDGSLPNAVLPFNTALDNGHCDFPHEMGKKHDDFVAIAACNTFGNGADRQYVGRFQQDAAVLERWVPVLIGYDEDLEQSLTDNKEWCQRVQKIRASIEELKIRHICSPRATIRGTKLLKMDWTISDTEDAVIWKGLEPETIRKIRQHAGV